MYFVLYIISILYISKPTSCYPSGKPLLFPIYEMCIFSLASNIQRFNCSQLSKDHSNSIK